MPILKWVKNFFATIRRYLVSKIPLLRFKEMTLENGVCATWSHYVYLQGQKKQICPLFVAKVKQKQITSHICKPNTEYCIRLQIFIAHTHVSYVLEGNVSVSNFRKQTPCAQVSTGDYLKAKRGCFFKENTCVSGSATCTEGKYLVPALICLLPIWKLL